MSSKISTLKPQLPLETAYEEFWEDLLREAAVSGDPQHAAFFSLYAEAAAENGDSLDLTYTPVRKEGSGAYQLDGYAIDQERGELYVAVCDFRNEAELQTLNQSQIELLFKRVERFISAATEPSFVSQLEETSAAFEAAYPINASWGDITRVRLLIFSNAKLVSRKKGIESRTELGRSFTYNLLDFNRFADIQNARNGVEPIEVDFEEFRGAPLPCLKATTGIDRYASYLAAVPGDLLAEIYGLYGARLLEQNVRTYLQARTKVNKGILATIDKSPEMFLAYNNGLTATASGVTTKMMPNGTLGIASISDLQIVNGGQTTASILYAKDRGIGDLGKVFVQMKLSVVDPEEVENIVPNISRYANTQNRISEADFFSNHPFHVELEKISRRLSAPQVAGSFSASKWFYERARGQYRDLFAYASAAVKKKLESEFPKKQVVVKTDLAKYELTFEARPHIVSLGSQKCFLAFAEMTHKRWEESPTFVNDTYFKQAMAKSIVFRWTDQMIAKSSWYAEDRGYKANLVTYTLSWLTDFLERQGRYIDFLLIWNLQGLPDSLKKAIEVVAPQVAAVIKKPPSEIKNISEYAKRQACWAAVQRHQVAFTPSLEDCTVDRSEKLQRARDAVAVKKIDDEIEFERMLLDLVPSIRELEKFSEARGLLSPKSAAALKKLAIGNISLNKTEKNAMRYLLQRLDAEGFQMPA